MSCEKDIQEVANLDTRILSKSLDGVATNKPAAGQRTSSHAAPIGFQHILSKTDTEIANQLAFFDMSKPLIEAVQEGNYPTAKKLLEINGLKFSEEAKGQAMKMAAEQGALDLLELLVEKSASEIYGFSIMLELIKFAVDNGRIALLQSLLDKGLPHVKRHLDKVGPNLYKTLFESFIGETYTEAAEAGQKDIVEYLFKAVGPFPPTTNGAALRAAGLHNHLSIVEFLLNNSKGKLPEEEIKYLFDFAIKHNSRQPLLEVILQHAKDLIPVKKIDHGFLYAIRHLSHAVSACLYQYAGAKMSSKTKVDACKAAALSGHLPTVQMLLPAAPKEGLKWLLNHASEKAENLPLLKILLKETSNKFTAPELDRRFARAVQADQFEIAECLFEKIGPRLADKTLKNALKISTAQQDLSFATFLLSQASNRFNWWDKVVAVWNGFRAQPQATLALINLFFWQPVPANGSAMAAPALTLPELLVPVVDSLNELNEFVLSKTLTPAYRQQVATAQCRTEATVALDAEAEKRSTLVIS